MLIDRLDSASEAGFHLRHILSLANRASLRTNAESSCIPKRHLNAAIELRVEGMLTSMNPASRLAQLHGHFSGLGSPQPMMDGWLQYLEIDPSSPTSDEDAFAGMNAALTEIRRVQERLQRLEAPPDLFARCADVLRQTLSPSTARAQFAGLRDQFLAREIGLALEWAAWTLSELDDPEMDDEAFRSLVQLVEQQGERLAMPQISDAMREMLESHVRQLRAALRLYKIEGPNAIHQVVKQAYGELHTATAEMVGQAEATPQSRAALQKGLELLGTAAKAADAASKIKKFAEDFYELGTKYGPPALGWAKTLLNNNAS